MKITRDEIELLFRLDEVHGYSKDAKRYVWSAAFAEDANSGDFFERHSMESDASG